MSIRSLTRSEKSARTRRRNKNPLRAKKLQAERPQPADGIERIEPKFKGGHTRIIPLTPEAKEQIYDDLFARSGGHCQGCRIEIYRQTFHPHHFKGRTRGKKCWCEECLQALCEDRLLSDNTTRFGCHSLAHLTIDGAGRFDPNKSTRLGEKFERGAGEITQ